MPDSARRQLQRHEMLAAGLDLLDQGITVFDAELRLVAWNQTFLRLLDFPPELAEVGTPFERFIRYNAERGEYGPGDPEAQIAERVELARHFTPHVRERRRPDGRLLFLRGEPLPHRGFITLYSDITEQRFIEDLIEHQNTQLEERVRRRTAQLENANASLRRLNEEKERMQAALVQAQKLEAIGQLTGGLAHDFNNLLTVVIGNLAALQEQRGDDPAVQECVEPALQSARRGVQLIKRLLTFSRQQPLAPEAVDVARLVGNLARLVRRSMPESVTVSTDLSGADFFVLADPGQLESALLNFALNARDAMPDGGRLHLAARAIELRGDAAAFDLAPGRYGVFEVVDNGCGMDAETQARACEPFFTTKRFGLGSGLGLAMAYGFARQSGGGLSIRSTPGRGTTLLLALPLATAPAVPEEASEEQTPAHGGELTLLVEDDAQVRQLVRKQLLELGYPVIEAENGIEALDMIAQIPDIAVLVSDVLMPGGINGHQLAEAVRNHRPDMRIVLMSGYSDDAPADYPILAKPFLRQDLARALLATSRSPA